MVGLHGPKFYSSRKNFGSWRRGQKRGSRALRARRRKKREYLGELEGQDWAGSCSRKEVERYLKNWRSLVEFKARHMGSRHMARGVRFHHKSKCICYTVVWRSSNGAPLVLEFSFRIGFACRGVSVTVHAWRGINFRASAFLMGWFAAVFAEFLAFTLFLKVISQISRLFTVSSWGDSTIQLE